MASIFPAILGSDDPHMAGKMLGRLNDKTGELIAINTIRPKKHAFRYNNPASLLAQL